MSRLIVVSCGNSLSQQAVCWKGLAEELGVGRDELSMNPKLVDERESLRWKARRWVGNLFARGDSDAAKVFDADAWRAGTRGVMSAELDTLRVYDSECATKRRGPAKGDVITFFHGEEVAIEAHATKRILESVEWSNHEYGSPAVEDPKPIAGLDAKDPVRFQRALDDALNSLYQRVQRETTSPRVETVFCLSGGYKGTVAGLLLLARRLGRDACSVDALYLHESSPNLIRLPQTGFTYLGAESRA